MPNKIISLGGSVIIPEKLDVKFLMGFKELILNYIKSDKFVIYCGGGHVAREFQNTAKKFQDVSENDLDVLGIYATWLNAYFLKTIFGRYANDEIIINPRKKIYWQKKIAIAGGWKPGWSTDYDAVLIAKQLGTDRIINITNVNYIYNKEPKNDKSAMPIKRISWTDFRGMFIDEWKPGLNIPFDPVASREAEKSKIKVIITGNEIKNLKRIFDGESFEGTLIH